MDRNSGWVTGRTDAGRTGGMGRWAAIGMLGLLVLIAGLSLAATAILRHDTATAARSAVIADGVQDARLEAAESDVALGDLAAEPNTEHGGIVTQAIVKLTADLHRVAVLPGVDPAVVARTQSDAKVFETDARTQRAMVEQGHLAEAAAFDAATTDPAIEELTVSLGRLEEQAHTESQRNLDTAQSRGADVALATPLLLAGSLLAGIVLLLALSRYRRSLVLQAETDALTGLPNRTGLAQQAGRLLDNPPGSTDGDPVLLLADLDHFKEINDGLGHHIGDQLLVQVANRLRTSLAKGDVVARLGGDEFAIVLPSGGHSAGETVAARVRARMREPFLLDGLRVDLDASIGVAVHHSQNPGLAQSTPLGELLRRADIAMYQAKQSGAGYVVHTEAADDPARERLVLISELRRAIDYDELILHYQPKVALEDHRLVGVEALLRWNHPEKGLLQPDQFLPQVEGADVMDRITSAVLIKALQQARQWIDRGSPLPVAVNIPTRSLLNHGFPAQVQQLLDQTGVDPGLLCLEITETGIMRDSERCTRTLRQLYNQGVRISIDDYGTGYASLSYLKNLPIHELKIDRSYITNLAGDPRLDALTRSIIDLGHSLGLTVLAEGVEDRTIEDALRDAGCDTAQGYYYGRPVPPDQINHFDETTRIGQHV